MHNIGDLVVSMDVSFARRHKQQLSLFFKTFEEYHKAYTKIPLLSYQISPSQFDDLGTLWKKESEFDAKSLKLIQTIENSYLSTSFFIKKQPNLIGSRGHVYYCTAITDTNDQRRMTRLANFTDITTQLIGQLYPSHAKRWEFGIYALLDDLRYKLLILDECFDEDVIDSAVLQESVSIFYDYLQGIMPEVATMRSFVQSVQAQITNAIQSRPDNPVRSYKEADNPLQNLTFRDTLVSRLGHIRVGSIIGIRYGGSELPFILHKYLPHASIQRVRISNYSGNKGATRNSGLYCIDPSRPVLILDDNILTGRTLGVMVDKLKKMDVKDIYFGCVTYSGMKRYPQMIMDGHGVVNTDVLAWSCAVGESAYTKITNSRSYKNQNGVFDKIKYRLGKRMVSDNMELEL
jgi:hypoxanthine phosphoribosyltransferase